MSFRWDKLLATKNTLIRYRDPTTDDALNYDHGVIWINQPENKAWLLRDGTVTLLPPTSGAAVDITDHADYSDLQNSITELENAMDNVIKSEPGAGDYKITHLKLDEDKKIVFTHNAVAE